MWDFDEFEDGTRPDLPTLGYGLVRTGDAALALGVDDSAFLGTLWWSEDHPDTRQEENSLPFRLVFDDLVIANADEFGQLFDLGAIAAAELPTATFTSAPDEFDAGRGGSGGSEPIDGTSSADTLVGSIGTDTITAFAGADIVDAGYGNDRIVDSSGSGNDQMTAGSGATRSPTRAPRRP